MYVVLRQGTLNFKLFHPRLKIGTDTSWGDKPEIGSHPVQGHRNTIIKQHKPEIAQAKCATRPEE